MVLRGMSVSTSGTPWSQFSAMAILVSIHIIIFAILQRYLVGGLAVGGVRIRRKKIGILAASAWLRQFNTANHHRPVFPAGR